MILKYSCVGITCIVISSFLYQSCTSRSQCHFYLINYCKKSNHYCQAFCIKTIEQFQYVPLIHNADTIPKHILFTCNLTNICTIHVIFKHVKMYFQPQPLCLDSNTCRNKKSVHTETSNVFLYPNTLLLINLKQRYINHFVFSKNILTGYTSHQRCT